MNRTETLELLIEIQEAIQHFKKRIDEAEWSNGFVYWLRISKHKQEKHAQHNYLRYVHRQT